MSTNKKKQKLDAAPEKQTIVQKFQASKNKPAFVKDIEERKDKTSQELEFMAAVYNTGIKEFKIKPDPEKAAKFVLAGAEAGSTACMISWAEQNIEKEGVKAKAMLESALARKDFRAANALGVLAMKTNNLNEAIAKFELAESHNVANAKQNVCVSKLQKVMISVREALDLLKDVMSKQG